MPGTGPESAKIILVGEAPGAEEERSNLPFVGQAGQLLDSFLLQAGLRREEVFITNTNRCRPPGNRAPEKEEIEACAEYLDAEIERIKPKVIVPLGATALYRILNLEKITKVRGTVYESEKYNCTVIPSFHPAYILRNRTSITEQALLNDLIRAKTIATTGIVNQEETDVKYFVAKTIDDAAAVFKRLGEVEAFSIDTETTGFDFIKGKILCVSFSWAEKTGVCIPIYSQFLKPFWNTDDHLTIINGLKTSLENSAIKILYNGKFDVKFFKTLGIKVENFVFDPMLAHHLIDENAKGSRGLEDLASLYLGIPSYKQEVQKYLGGDSNVGYEVIPDFILWPYACKDVDLTFRLYKRFLPILEKERLARLYTKIVMPLQEVLTESEYRGVKIDTGYVKSLVEKSETWKQDVMAKLRSFPVVLELEKELNAGKKKAGEFNFSSSQQVSKLLFEKLKLPTVKKTKANKDSVGAETLKQLESKHPIIPLISRYKKIIKLKSTYVDDVLEKLDESGYLHTEYQVAGTVTGRLSCLQKGTPIVSIRGSIPIEEIKPGDLVLTQFGYKKVLNVFKGISPLRELTAQGRQIFATPKHQFLNNNGEFVELKDLKVGDIICGTTLSPSQKKKRSFSISPQEAEFLGYVMGDGCIRKGYKKLFDAILLAVAPSDKDLIPYFQRVVQKLYKKDCKFRRTKTCFEGRIMSVDVARRAQRLGVGGLAHEKEIPLWLYTAPLNVVEAFLRGLFEADGWVNSISRNVGFGKSAHIGFCSVSKRLVFGIARLLDLFGIRVKVYYVDNTQVLSARGIWKLNVLGPLSKRKFISSIGFISSKKKTLLSKLPSKVSFNDTFDVFHISSPFKGINLGNMVKQKAASRGVVQKLSSGGLTPLSKLFDIFVQNAQFHAPITKIKRVRGVHEVYDLEVENVHQYIVNGLICHNSQSPNLQNIPRDDTIKSAYGEDLDYNVIKRMFLPRHGYVMIEADYAQIEYRVFANYVKDPKMIQDIRSGLDIHRKFAATVFNVPLEKVTKLQRTQAKFAVFGIMYGRGAESVAEQYNISKREAQLLIDTFLSQYPMVRPWIAAMQRRATTTGKVSNLFGRVRRLTSAMGDNREGEKAEALRQSINAPIQSGAADITYIAIIRINRRLRDEERNANILLTVHDSIILEVPELELERTIQLIREEMTRPIEGVDVPLEVEIKLGENWGQLKEWKENE